MFDVSNESLTKFVTRVFNEKWLGRERDLFVPISEKMLANLAENIQRLHV